MLLPVVLRNLIGNAIKYTQRGGVRLRVRRDHTHLYLDVIDSGPGIPAEHLPRLYEAFYQIDNPHRDQRRGVGLGLSIVQTICRLLDHTVTIESLIAAGTTFTVRLPLGVAAEYRANPDPVPAPAAIPAPATRTAKILHIEDEPSVAQSMAMLLRLEGYEVIGAASRDEALQHIRIHGVRPDLILSDFQLPMGFSGDEIVAEIAALLHFKPPTIILTGDIDQKHIERARLLADRILPKPVDIGLLLSEMDQLIGKRLN
jgi:CheY-like chemotaxis protein